jgi:hypothetical protein
VSLLVAFGAVSVEGALGAGRVSVGGAPEPGPASLVAAAQELGESEALLWDGTKGTVVSADEQVLTLAVARDGPSEQVTLDWGRVRALGAGAARRVPAGAAEAMDTLWRAERALARGDAARCADLLAPLSERSRGARGPTAARVFALERDAAAAMGDTAGAFSATLRGLDASGVERIETADLPWECVALVLDGQSVPPGVVVGSGSTGEAGNALARAMVLALDGVEPPDGADVGGGPALLAAAVRTARRDAGVSSGDDRDLLRAAAFDPADGVRRLLARAALACAAAGEADPSAARGGVLDLVELSVDERTRMPGVARAALSRAAEAAERAGDAETAARLRTQLMLVFGGRGLNASDIREMAAGGGASKVDVGGAAPTPGRAPAESSTHAPGSSPAGAPTP